MLDRGRRGDGGTWRDFHLADAALYAYNAGMTTQGMLGRVINGALALVTFAGLRWGLDLDATLAAVAALGVWCAPVAP